MISYNQQHGIIFIKKHILAKHLAVWCRWKITNLGLTMEEQQWKKSKNRSMVSYGAIKNPFQLVIPYTKGDAQ
jgi:hypothetical protein